MQSEEMYKIIADNTLDTIVLVDNEAVVRYVSPSMGSQTGYSPAQYEGMDAFDVIHPEDRERVRFSHAVAMQTKNSVDVEYRLVHAQGHLLYVETRVKPVLDDEGNVQYVVAVVRDVTERKKAEQLLQNILDNVNAGVMSANNTIIWTACFRSI